MPTDDKITARIRGLLELSKSDNVHEAGNAAAQAQALMSRHSITEAMVSGADKATSTGGDIEVGLLHKHDGKNMPLWKKILCYNVCSTNQCHGYKFGSELRIIGRPSDVDKVRLLFSYVVAEIDRLADQEATLRGIVDRTWKNNFRSSAAKEVNRGLLETTTGARRRVRQDARQADNTSGMGTLALRVERALETLREVRHRGKHLCREHEHCREHAPGCKSKDEEGCLPGCETVENLWDDISKALHGEG